MESEYVTTPFGRRAMSLGMLANQQRAETITAGATRNKWKLFRAVCEARRLLGVTERALTVLDALLTFHPGDTLTEGQGLVVFPSNAQLSLRAKGMAPATLRRHLGVLVEHGLIVRRDSPNGKRYVRRDKGGEIEQAFGFSLTPLLARATEIETMAADVVADRARLSATRERLTLCRRDIGKLIASAVAEAVPGDWDRIFVLYRDMVDSIPRAATVASLSPVLDNLEMLRAEIINILETQVNSVRVSGRESQTERHRQISKPDILSDSERSDENRQESISTTPARSSPPKSRDGAVLTSATPARKPWEGSSPIKIFPLGLVLRACPGIVDYAPGGKIETWRNLMSAAIVVRTMLEISASAYEEACTAMGPENAATVVAYILERAGHITSAGGYLRNLTRRAEKGQFAVGQMLQARIRATTPEPVAARSPAVASIALHQGRGGGVGAIF